jgi:hypothetical protein
MLLHLHLRFFGLGFVDHTGQTGHEHRSDRSRLSSSWWTAPAGQLPPNPTPDRSIHSTDSHKTLGIVGTPHGHSIDKLWSTKTHRIKRNRRISAKNAINPWTMKTPKSSPFSHGFGRGIKGKWTMKGSCIYLKQIAEIKASKLLQEKRQEKAPKFTKKENREKLKQALRNHAKSSIHTMKVHTRSSFRLIILPSHKISTWSSQVSPRNSKGKWKGKNGKTKWVRVPRDGCQPLATWVICRQPKV